MSIFIDSANLDEIEKALDLGWVSGVTTNPLLLGKEKIEVAEHLQKIRSITSGPIFYQLMSDSFAGMLDEAHKAQEILEKQLVVKLPPTDLGFKVCSELNIKMLCCPTAIYSPAQALIASEAGAQYIAIYVNRATRLMDNGIELTQSIAEILQSTPTALLAASLKSPGEAIAAVKAGANHLTLPFTTLVEMSKHELSEAATRQFNEEGFGLAKG